ncbi:MAG: M48 family metallopeptidase [Candidatus Omnitrophica bacterium]|nr:M48 family metallopeptidase [Candidatus Omnitrophota bacterium]
MERDSDKVKRYTRIKHTVAIIDIVFMIVLLVLFQISGLSSGLRSLIARSFNNQPLLILIYSFVLINGYFVINIPLSFYNSYVVEHRFGLSNQSAKAWFSDYFKAGFLSVALFIILIEAFAYFLRSYPADWWWMCSVFWVILSVIIARLFPVIVIPLFYKYKRIENEEMRRRILDLSAKMGIKVLDIFQIDMSSKTEKANAGLVGLGRTKRVVLGDTLEGKFSPEEIEVILAHEFAHFRLRHLVKIIVLNAALIFLVFYIFFRFGHIVFDPLGVRMSDIAGLPLWILLFTVWQIALTPMLNWISRGMERNADKMALAFTGKKDEFISMMEKLAEQNLSERKPPLWIKIFFYDHPPVEERVACAREFEGKQ